MARIELLERILSKGEIFIMSVPESVRNVSSPVDTIVEDSVRVIGHIIYGMFVPRMEKTTEKPDIFVYVAAASANLFSHEIYHELLVVYPIRDTVEIIAVAVLKGIRPGIASNRYSTEYQLYTQ